MKLGIKTEMSPLVFHVKICQLRFRFRYNSSGAPIGFADWMPNQPDNLDDEECVLLFMLNGPKSPTWRNAKCQVSQPCQLQTCHLNLCNPCQCPAGQAQVHLPADP